MAQAKTAPGIADAGAFDPDTLVEKWANGELAGPNGNDLQAAVKETFGLKENDSYTYHAVMSVTLAECQRAINHGDKSGLHVWYLDEDGKPLSPPPLSDTESYIFNFLPTTSTSKALTSFAKNAKKNSIRSRVAANLGSKRKLPPNMTIPKLKKPHVNPYFDFWAWSCRNLEFCGPDESAIKVKRSHHILPILYHHFGCVCPSFESLEIIRQVAKNKVVLDLGSGNGYWTYMLRRLGVTVEAVDNGDSLWRTTWIGDTIKDDGAKYLEKHNRGKDRLLLLVYPQVTTHFTKSVLSTYAGDTICVAGTQNENGFTGFKDMTFDKYMAAERPDFEKLLQTPLPSFAGKDEALFVFQRGP